MAIDYIVEYSCRPKSALTPQRMIDFVKARDKANTVLSILHDSGDQRSPSEIRFQSVLKTTAGVQQREVSVQNLLTQAEELNAYESHCQECPANALRHPFGCFGSISYPIQHQTEKRLMSLLPGELDSTAGFFLRKAVADFGYDGSPLQKMRRQSIFFERRKPVVRKWGVRSRWQITADQLLQMMFCLGALQSSHCSMLSLFLGLIPHDIDPEKLRDIASLKQSLTGADVRLPQDSEQTQQIKGFLNALAIAATVDVSLLVDF